MKSPTGRLSAQQPAFQNIPVRTPDGAKIREAFMRSRSMKDAQIFTRRNGHMSASCDGVADTGYEVTENGRGLYTVYSVDDPDQTIAVDVSREEAEKAITEDWRKPRT